MEQETTLYHLNLAAETKITKYVVKNEFGKDALEFKKQAAQKYLDALAERKVQIAF